MKLIDPRPIKKFIVDGLNNPDLKKAFGHDAIEILAEIEYAPTIEVAMNHGRWNIDKSFMPFISTCSECGAIYDADGAFEWNYCPHCGAKMDGGKDNV